MSKHILIRNGRLLDSEIDFTGDLVVSGGKIDSTGPPGMVFNSEVFEIDAAGMVLIPGGIDPHVHLSLPTPAGPSCDDFLTGSRAALSGGTTTFFDFITPLRGESLVKACSNRQAESHESITDCHLHLGISEWNERIARELPDCIDRFGIRSLKAYLAYGNTIGIGYSELKEVMKLAAGKGLVVMVHCEDDGMIDDARKELLERGLKSPHYHALSRPAGAEVKAIGKVVELAAVTGCRTYVVHISTSEGAALVGSAKRSGIEVYGETCPQYLLFDESVYDPGKPGRDVLPFVFSPPARSNKDREGLWEALADGTLDVVATDHCPFYTKGQKDRGLLDFTLVPNGAGGVEHRLSLLFTHGVLSGRITFSQFVRLVSTNPARIFGLGGKKGRLSPGMDADIVIWNPGRRLEISAASHRSMCDSDIYEGITVTGAPWYVIHGGILAGV